MTSKKNWPVFAFSFLVPCFAFAQSSATKPLITLESAKAVISSAAQSAPKGHPPLVICVVDDGGQLIYLERADGIASGMVQAAIGKARAAALYGYSTKMLEQQIVQGHPGFQNLPDMLPVEGGIPVVVNGQLAGAVGVAGGASPDDGALAEKTASALAAF